MGRWAFQGSREPAKEAWLLRRSERAVEGGGGSVDVPWDALGDGAEFGSLDPKLRTAVMAVVPAGLKLHIGLKEEHVGRAGLPTTGRHAVRHA